MFKYLLFLLVLVTGWGTADAQFFNRMTTAQQSELIAAKMGAPAIPGVYYFVDSADGSDDHSGLLPERAVATLAAALAKCDTTSGGVWKGDGIILLTTVALTAPVTWSSSNVAMFGVNGAKVISGAGAGGDTIASLITMSGSFNSIDKVVFANTGDSVTALTGLTITGSYNKITDCEIVGGASAGAGAGAVVDLFLNGGDNNTITRCLIGSDNVDRTVATICGNVKFDGTANWNRFIDCETRMHTDDVDHCAIWNFDATAMTRTNLFQNCLFEAFNDSAGLLSLEMVVDGAAAPATGAIILDKCTSVGFDSVSANSWNRVPRTQPAATLFGGKALFD